MMQLICLLHIQCLEYYLKFSLLPIHGQPLSPFAIKIPKLMIVPARCGTKQVSNFRIDRDY